MWSVLLIGLGGAFGACGRFGVSRITAPWERTLALPMATLVVNVIGCFLIGWIATHFATRGGDVHLWRHLTVIGFLGGFTTYSAFGLENVQLLQQGAFGAAMANIAAHLVLGLGAVWLGMTVAAAA